MELPNLFFNLHPKNKIQTEFIQFFEIYYEFS